TRSKPESMCCGSPALWRFTLRPAHDMARRDEDLTLHFKLDPPPRVHEERPRVGAQAVQPERLSAEAVSGQGFASGTRQHHGAKTGLHHEPVRSREHGAEQHDENEKAAFTGSGVSVSLSICH